jgi:leucyl aminopeptidase
MSSRPSVVPGGTPVAPPLSARTLAVALALAASVALASPSLAAAQAAPPAADDSVWITLGADVFERAQHRLAPGPVGAPLPRVAEALGVVVTRVPHAQIDALSELVHREFRRCGGFIAHASLAAAEAALARLSEPRPERVALPFVIDQPWWVSLLADEVSETELLGTMTSLSTLFPNRYHLHHAIHHSADWILGQWTAYAAGRPDVTVTLYSHGGITPQPSVVLTIPGSTLASEFVILGGHQDSTRFGCSIPSNPGCDAPGADDDGSGIATLSEVIRVALANDFRPQRTVQFIGYAAEEVGLYGSEDIAGDYLAAGTDVVAVLNQDMTGYHGSVQDMAMISDYTDPELTAFVVDLLETYQTGLTWTSDFCGYACSDHAPWYERGFRSAFAFEAQFSESNPNIHSADDTVAMLGDSAAHAAKFARMAAAFLVETTLDGDVMPFLDGFETSDTSRWSATIP